VLGRCGADHRAHVVQAAGGAGRAEPVDEPRDVLPHALAAVGAQVLDVGGAGVRRAHEHEEARAGHLQRAQRVDAHVGAGREGVDAEAVDGAEGRRGRAGERLAIGGGGDVDVAALGVGQDEQALRVRLLHD
jgi:hypothetical protein